MTSILAHRGPDGQGVWSDGPIGFGHRMLRTSSQSQGERHPLVSTTGDLVLTADARIDNRRELLSALGRGSTTPHIADSELILAAYERWGERCAERLLGDFAFAIWDRRRQTVFCARDHFGVKPFYYYCSGRAFVFASEIKALLCIPEVPRRLNEARVAEYLAEVFDDKSSTFYQHIVRLPPSHSMTVSSNGERLRKYWTLDPSRELRLSSEEDYDEAFREVFTEAVRCRLTDASQLGSTLSGGLDSSSVTCVARKLLAENGSHTLQTLSVVFNESPECDERPFINTVLAQGGLEPHYISADPVSPLTDIDSVLWHQDEPFFNPNMYIMWEIVKAANRHGVRVLLDGVAGDIAVGHGVAYLGELARQGRWDAFASGSQRLSNYFQRPATFYLERYGLTHLRELARKGRWLALARQTVEVSKHFDVSPWSLAYRHGLRPLAPSSLGRARQALGLGRFRKATSEPFIHPEFSKRIGLDERVEESRRSRPKSAATPREAHCRSLDSGVNPFNFEILDRAAAAFSVELRHPFADTRMVEFCLSLPAEYKLRDGWSRFILRHAMGGILPDQVRWRERHSNLAPNFVRALRAFEGRRLEDMAQNDFAAVREYVDPVPLRAAYRGFVRKDAPGSEVPIWKSLTLALWLEHTGLGP